MTELTNLQAASSLAELFRASKTQTQNGFKDFLHETGVTSELCRDSSATVNALVGEFAELVTKFGLDTDTYPDAAARIQQISLSLYATSAILAEIADYAESASGATDSTAVDDDANADDSDDASSPS